MRYVCLLEAPSKLLIRSEIYGIANGAANQAIWECFDLVVPSHIRFFRKKPDIDALLYAFYVLQ